MAMARYFIRLLENGRVLAANADDVFAFDDLGSARYEAMRGAKQLLLECISTGRDPTNDAVLIVDGNGQEVETIRLLDALPEVMRDRLGEG